MRLSANTTSEVHTVLRPQLSTTAHESLRICCHVSAPFGGCWDVKKDRTFSK